MTAHRLANTLAKIHSAKLELDVLRKDKEIVHDTKRVFGQMSDILGQALNKLKYALKDDYWQILQERLINDENSLQVENVLNMFIDLPPERQDMFEELLTALHKGEEIRVEQVNY